MRKAELEIGEEYAIQRYDEPEAARVRVQSIGAGQSVTVQVVDPGPMTSGEGWRAGQTVKTTSRKLTCRYADWSAIAAQARQRRAEQQAAWRERQEAWEYAATPDPDRRLPAAYGDERVYPPDDGYGAQLAEMKAFPPRWARHAEGLLNLLPEAVQRDVLAAVRHAAGRPRLEPFAEAEAEGGLAVRTVFGKTADLILGAAHGSGPRLGEILDDMETDEAFLQACLEAVRCTGGDLLLPFVPRVRHDSRYGQTLSVRRPALGWLRLAVGYTSGSRQHHPSCHILKSNAERPEAADTIALWESLADLSERCGVCRGPGLRVDGALVAFRAAASVWLARERSDLEAWQLGAAQHLLASAALARALMAEPDVTLKARVVDALAEDLPGQEGWAAYRLASQGGWAVSMAKDPIAITEGLRLACRRLRSMHELLPGSRRPEVPFPLENVPPEGNIPGPQPAAAEALKRWRERLAAAVEVPGLDGILFGMPGAQRL